MNLNTPFKNYRKRSSSKNISSPEPVIIPQIGTSNTPSNLSTKNNNIVKYSVLYRKFTNKKNKTWEGDGTLIWYTNNDIALIKNEDDTMICKLKDANKSILKGSFSGSGYEFELDEEIVTSKIPKLTLSSTPTQIIHKPIIKPFKSPLLTINSNNNKNNIIKNIDQKDQKGQNIIQKDKIVDNKKVQDIITKSSSSKQTKETNRLKSSDPLYDIKNVQNPLFMPDFPKSIDDSEIHRKVVVDPVLSVKLRDHQRYGVEFLYSCLMGLKSSDINGAILADEMGLGKTLQTITLIWTLLRQSHIVGKKPIIDKVLICCPVSLVSNWKNEFSKWLGMNRVGVLAINGNKFQNEVRDIQLFPNNKVYQVMIIGYEKMQSMSELLSEITFDLLICDEGHRLKSSENKAIKTLKSFNIKRTILLSGTPIQNDLTEFYTMADFVNPGVLGSLKHFQKTFVKPILSSRDAKCTNKALIKKGKEKSKELVELTNKFILRRLNDELTKYLPKRSDYILFIAPTSLQLQLFKTIIETKRFQTLIDGETDENSSTIKNSSSSSSSLNLINSFRKICNSPSLLKTDSFFLDISERSSNSAEDVEFRNQLGKKVKSGKILVLIKLLGLLYAKNDEKVVIVSNFTATLDIIESIFQSLGLAFTRLDGSTPSNERGKIVDSFNKSSTTKSFAMLLSAKAGGVGLNLIGASRLILFDNDWNPAVDLQAIARIHRDGQMKDVKVYRFLTNGCMDEKIFQRQLVKQDLSDRFVDQKGGEKEIFDRSDLKDIFTINFDKIKTNQYCNTHELMCCDCNGKGEIVLENEFGSDLEDSNEESDEDEDEETKEKKKFMSALDYTQKYPYNENENTKVSEIKRKRLRRCLKGYRHIQPVQSSIVFKTDDDILDTLLNGQDREKPVISYVFGKY